MATLVSALGTDFTPAVGVFIAQATGGIAVLERKNSSGAAFAECGRIHNAAVEVQNSISGAVYRFRQVSEGGTVVVQADQ